MRRLILLMTAMAAAIVLVVSGVAYALSVQCDGTGDQDPDPGQCQGTDENDVITGTAQRDFIFALRGKDDVTARGGDDVVGGDRGNDFISGEVGGDSLHGGPRHDTINGGPGTSDASDPPHRFSCTRSLPDGTEASTQGNQLLRGQDGNDLLAGGIDNDWLQGGGGRNDRLGKDDLSGNGGDDCLILGGAENERAGGGDGDDIIFADVRNGGDDIFCGAGIDTVEAHLKDRVAANCENVLRLSRPGATGATPEAEVTISTPEGTITMTPQEIGS